jgi:Tfp pilus assembly protein FimT
MRWRPPRSATCDGCRRFQSDGARLVAIILVCVTLIAIFCLPRLAKVWAEDRADRRAHERSKAALIAAVDEARARREAERVKRDD